MLYSLADVFANPTYADIYPTVNLEAMACGTPVITYKTGGIPEAVTPETGRVVKQGDIKELSETILMMPPKYSEQGKTLSRQCRVRAEECFDKEKCFERCVELYESMI